MRYLVINSTGYGLGDTVRDAIDSYREAVRPGAQVEHWQVGIAPDGDEWIMTFGGGFNVKSGGEPILFDLDLR